MLAFGVIYGLVTLIGLIDGEDVLGLIPVNAEDNVLALAAVGAALVSRAGDRTAGRRVAATR